MAVDTLRRVLQSARAVSQSFLHAEVVKRTADGTTQLSAEDLMGWSKARDLSRQQGVVPYASPCSIVPEKHVQPVVHTQPVSDSGVQLHWFGSDLVLACLAGSCVCPPLSAVQVFHLYSLLANQQLLSIWKSARDCPA